MTPPQTAPQTMPQGMNPLDALEPNILPEQIGLWPPALGWWILATVIVLTLTGAGIVFWRWYTRNAYRREACKKLDSIQKSFEHHQDQLTLVKQYNHLLKAVALNAFPRDQVASLHGDAWLQFLDKHLKQGTIFTKGVGSILGHGAYSPETCAQPESLYPAVKQWIRKHKIIKDGQPHA